MTIPWTLPWAMCTSIAWVNKDHFKLQRHVEHQFTTTLTVSTLLTHVNLVKRPNAICLPTHQF